MKVHYELELHVGIVHIFHDLYSLFDRVCEETVWQKVGHEGMLT